MKTGPESAAATMPSRPPARQKRSQRTFEKLIAAAARVLDRDGLDAATVPRIAAEARLSPASIYRRFADKDDLLRLAFLRLLEAAHARNAAHLRDTLVRDNLAETVEALVGNLLRQYRDHPHLMHALARVLEGEPDSAFARDPIKLKDANLTETADLLLAHRDSIRHPDPERAVRFATLAAVSAIETAALGRSSPWRTALPLTDKAFAAELARQMLGYLRRKP